ncbi:MAG: ArnT family glycosyltransferase [Thermoproteota archaeon]
MRNEQIERLLIIFSVSLAIRLIWVLNDPPLYYDEAEFILLARSLLNGNGYTLPYGTWQSARPPLLPFLLFCMFWLFGESQTLAHLTCVVSSSLAVLATYFLTEEIYDNKIALFSAFFTAINPIHIALASAILSENLFSLIEPLFILAVLKANRLKWTFTASILFALLFMSRYSALYVGLFISLWMVFERRTQLIELLKSPTLYFGSVVAIFILIPWFLVGQHYYNGPLNSAIVYASLQGSYRSLSDLLMFSAASISTIVAFPLFLLPFFIIGLLKDHNPWRNFLLMWIATSIILSVILEPLVRISPMVAVTYMLRYNFISFPAFALATGRGINNILQRDIHRNAIKALIITLFLLSSSASIYLPYYNRYIRTQDIMVKSYKEASAYLSMNSRTDEYVLTNSPAFISYYSKRDCLLIPSRFQDLMGLLWQSNSSYMVISFWEAQTDGPPPSYLSEIMNNGLFKLVYTSNMSDKPVVYIFYVGRSRG